jgi:hypothetical protein
MKLSEMESEYWPSNPRISDLISRLEDLKAEHGNLPITYKPLRGGVVYADVSAFKVAYVRPKEKRERTWSYRIGTAQEGDLKVVKF